MLKEVVASNAAKLIAACVCPVVGTAAITVSVPKVRQAVHKMTAPAKPTRTARAKPRVRAPGAAANQPSGLSSVICPEPVIFTNNPLQPFVRQTPDFAPPPPERTAALLQPNYRVPAPAGFAGPGVFGGGGGGGGGFGPNPGTPGGGDGERTDPPPPAPPGGGIEPPPPIPEPSTWAQLMLGFAVVGGVTRFAWRQRARAAEASA